MCTGTTAPDKDQTETFEDEPPTAARTVDGTLMADNSDEPGDPDADHPDSSDD